MNQINEVNFDGLVGPTHNFAGLAFGNIASQINSSQKSNPKKAALQGLKKMMHLHQLGCPQGVLPPHERPHLPSLRALGFDQPLHELLPKMANDNPDLLMQVSSASAMWVANAATVSCGRDTADQKTHFTPANLASMYHRSIESNFTGSVLKTIFAHPDYFHHHAALPCTNAFGDEGAANHTRFSDPEGDNGLSLFVYGKSSMTPGVTPNFYPARQTLEASQSIARQHKVNKSIFAQQNPDVIDQGVFHNDVIAVGARNILLCHEQAFLNQCEILDAIQHHFGTTPFYTIEIKNDQISVKEAVATYLFNTQIIFTNTDEAQLIAPTECEENSNVASVIQDILEQDNPIKKVAYFDLRQSMKNGGGPACLRLRVPMDQITLEAINPKAILTPSLYEELVNWIEKHYRDELELRDLADPDLYLENRAALDELTQIMALGSIYEFQK